MNNSRAESASAWQQGLYYFLGKNITSIHVSYWHGDVSLTSSPVVHHTLRQDPVPGLVVPHLDDVADLPRVPVHTAHHHDLTERGTDRWLQFFEASDLGLGQHNPLLVLQTEELGVQPGDDEDAGLVVDGDH